jgi:hypothetical protein
MNKSVTTFILGLLAMIVTPQAARAAAEQPWKFVVMGDTRSNPCDADGGITGINGAVIARLAVAVAAEKPELVLVPGDMILGNGYSCKPFQTPPAPAESQFRAWRLAMKPVYDSGAKVLPVRGNHEMDKDAALSDWSSCRKRIPVEQKNLEAFRRVFNDPYLPTNGPLNQQGLTYALAHRNALFIALDQTVDQFQVDQQWFDRTLAMNKLPHLFAFGHYPAFSVKHKDSLACYGEARDRFWDAFGNGGGRLYFCGHDHFYDRATIKDRGGRTIQQVLVGNGGAPFTSFRGNYPDQRVRREQHLENSYGYLVVTVTGTEVSTRLKLLDGGGAWQTGDAFSYSVPQ